MMLLLLIFVLPDHEIITYRTYDEGKEGTMSIVSERDSVGLHVTYTWEDRVLEVIFDTVDMSTRYVRKAIGDKVELKVERQGDKFKVHFKGKKQTYNEKKPVYDRHAIEFALRGMTYDPLFDERIRFHVPEFMIINADVKVAAVDTIQSQFGAIPCWKIRLKPRVIFTNMVFYFWIEKEFPFRFLKYEDSSGKHAIELIEYTSS